MAYTLVGGVVVATVLTLIFLPAGIVCDLASHQARD